MRNTATIIQSHSRYFLDDEWLEQPVELEQPILIVTACLVLAAFALLLTRCCCSKKITQLDHSRPLIDSACYDEHHQAATILSPFASLEAQTQNWSPESAESTSQHVKHHKQQLILEVKHGMASTATESTTDRQLAATKLLAHRQFRVTPGSLSSSGSNHYFEYNQHQPPELDAHGPGESGILPCQQVQQRQENIPPGLAEIQPYQELSLPQPNTGDNLVHPLPGQLTLGVASNIASVAQRVSSPHLQSVPLPMPEATVKTEPEVTQHSKEASGHLATLTSQWSSGSFGAEVKEENQLASARNSLSSVTSSSDGFAMSLRQTCPASRHWHALASVPEGDEPSFAAGLLAQKPVAANQGRGKQDKHTGPGLCITPFHGQLSKMTAAEVISHGIGDKDNRTTAVSDAVASHTSPMRAAVENVHNAVMPGDSQRAEDAGKAEAIKTRESLPAVASGMASEATVHDLAVNPTVVLPVALEPGETAKYPALTVQTAVAICEVPDMPWELQAGSTVADRIQSLASLAVGTPRCSPMPSLQVAKGSPTSETRELGMPLMLPTPVPSLTTTSMLREGSLTRETGPNICSVTTVSGFEVRHATYRPPPSPVRRSLLKAASLTPPATDSCKPEI